jgi:hypothetical protein
MPAAAVDQADKFSGTFQPVLIRYRMASFTHAYRVELIGRRTVTVGSDNNTPVDAVTELRFHCRSHGRSCLAEPGDEQPPAAFPFQGICDGMRMVFYRSAGIHRFQRGPEYSIRSFLLHGRLHGMPYRKRRKLHAG